MYLLTCAMALNTTLFVLSLLFASAPSTTRKCPPYSNVTETCHLTVGDLDFLHEDSHNLSDVKWHRDVHRNWPCSVIKFWAEGWFHVYVGFVRFLYKWFLPLEIIVGVALNVFALRIISAKGEEFFRSKGRRSIVFILGQYQCSADIGALLITCSIGYGRSYVPAFDRLFLDYIWLCRAFKVLTAFLAFSSPWMNVFIVSKRLCDLKWPERSLRMTSKKAHRIMICLIVMLTVISSSKYYFSGFEQYASFEYERCEERGHTIVPMTSIYVALATYLPTGILFGVNYVLVGVIKRNKHPGDFRHCLKREEQNRKVIQMIWSVSIFYTVVQIPLGVVESYELYWNMTKVLTICRSEREAFAQWRITKLTLKWFRALLYLLNQLGFIFNFSCLLLTRSDFRELGKRFGLFSVPEESANSEDEPENISDFGSSASLPEPMDTIALLSYESSNVSYISQYRHYIREIRTCPKGSPYRKISRMLLRRRSV